jgi:predicted transposase/invertase (TIGR01784 family)
MSEIKMLSPEEKWEQATLANNFIFYKVMYNNPDVCKELLEILLQIKIDHIQMHSEETIEIDYGKKGVRLDVYAVGSRKAFNLEMQASDSGELAERSRYYQGILDVQELKSGEDYRELKDCYIIFICLKDIFRKGLAKYSFENICLEDNSIKLNDRAHKLFFIAGNYDKIFDKRQKAFLKLVVSNKSTDIFGEKVSKLVEDAKHNVQWRKQYMEWERQMAYKYREGLAEGKKVGILEGSRQKAIEDARSFFINGVSVELIAKSIGMTKEEVLEITKDLPTQIK